MIRLSVLDQSPVSEGSSPAEALAQTSLLAREAEQLGYHRFWVSEHHAASGLAGSSPEVLMAHLGAVTTKLRIGSGGVLLPHYSAYKVAENFRVLEGLYPGRIDLGAGRAPGGGGLATRALQENHQGRELDRYEQQLQDLQGYLQDETGPDHRFAGLLASPAVDTAPELWLLGSSKDSAALAAKQGMGFVFAQFINGDGGAEAVKAYVQSFRPSVADSKPRAMVAVFAVCAETAGEADRLASSIDLALVLLEKGHASTRTPSPEIAQSYKYAPFDLFRIQENRRRMVVGTPAEVKSQLEVLAESYQCEEIMVASLIHSFPDKLKSLQLIASACGLQGVRQG
ncbi:LLM class flavin-dependent oxidoreductase [Paenibacillus donghaensis]|uniref:LLM class flavin-dependent oxidoreductase n=1 Tax=Paenibacillus donghaensis TaxID=414771 RepID=A0A2Z2KM67_9BACL|nr:LLM class flavin-dependent oxidoreductase [Paenibacillus donghaensis]ASA24580.1 LLM class flavin-dependent oxidoreductase [Paenibacillus donghaensis]